MLSLNWSISMIWKCILGGLKFLNVKLAFADSCLSNFLLKICVYMWGADHKTLIVMEKSVAKLFTVAAAQEKVPLTGLPGTKFERTFIAFKPDAVQRGLVGEMIARFEIKGFKLVGIKILVPTPEFAAKHYDDLKSRPFFNGLCQYFSSGAVVAMVWEGKNAVVGGRKLIGATNPNDAAPGSLRGDFAIDVGRNLIHGSDSVDSAKAEISLWFTEKEIANYSHDTGLKWIYEK